MTELASNAIGENPATAALTLALILLLVVRKRRIRSAHGSEKHANEGALSNGDSTSPRPPPQPTRPQVNRDPEELAGRAWNSIRNIVAATNTVAGSDSDRDEYRRSVQESVIALICAVIMADGVVHEGECRFVRALVEGIESDGQCRSIIAFRSEQWSGLRNVTPRYFQAVADYDREHQTRWSQDVLSELKNIIRCTALADGNYTDSDLETTSDHIAHLEGVFRKAIWVVQWDHANEMPRIPIERTYRRDDYLGKRIV